MHRPFTQFRRHGLQVLLLVSMSALSMVAGARIQDPPPAPKPDEVCTEDFTLVGVMKDIVSNALTRGLDVEELDVERFLLDDSRRYASVDELMRATAKHFSIAEARLAEEVERYRHCNCDHVGGELFGKKKESGPSAKPAEVCTKDFTLVGVMKDIVSNALTRGLDVEELDVKRFLLDDSRRYASVDELMRATAKHFSIAEARLAEEVERYRHCNCDHVGGELFGKKKESGSSAPLTLSKFASDVTLHVVLHELGHALVREFDLPVLANEETMADAFATHYLVTHHSARAPDVLLARVNSLMIEAAEVPRAEWSVSGEHDNDARRAFQIAALAMAADPVLYAPVARAAGLTQDGVEDAVDYGAEIHRSWRRILQPLWMPRDVRSKEARVTCDASDALLKQVEDSGLVAEVDDALRRFDWHSNVKVAFATGDGTAGWNRSSRTVTVRRQYIARFIEQGERVKR